MHLPTIFFLAATVATSTAIPTSLAKRSTCGVYRDVNAPFQTKTNIWGGGKCQKLARPGETPNWETIYEFTIDSACEWCIFYPEEEPEDCAGGVCHKNCLDTGRQGEQITAFEIANVKGQTFPLDRKDKAYFKC